ncbi:MAG: PstS family phosphate ABC transporter substrate-binding protein [Actinomycetota bacterium]|nr:PstS family phosphate ABC transporter substrate-binding protein [Actinomycetota bacterium]
MKSNLKNSKIIPLIIILLMLSFLLLSSCKSKGSQRIDTSDAGKHTEESERLGAGSLYENDSLIITGSTTLLEVTQKWSEEFMKKYGGKITVNGGGSGEGIAALLNGTTDLADSSRLIKQEELDKAKSLMLYIKEFKILYDGVCIITSKNVDVKELTLNQLADIYMNKITNWNQIGGLDSVIVAVARDSNSGTGEYFLRKVIQKDYKEKDNDYSPNCLRLQSSSDIINQIANNDNGIGYVGLGYLKDAGDSINVISVKNDDNSTGVMPGFQTIADKSYPIARDMFVYATGKDLKPLAQAFIDFILSDDGQKIGQDAGFAKIS